MFSPQTAYIFLLINNNLVLEDVFEACYNFALENVVLFYGGLYYSVEPYSNRSFMINSSDIFKKDYFKGYGNNSISVIDYPSPFCKKLQLTPNFTIQYDLTNATFDLYRDQEDMFYTKTYFYEFTHVMVILPVITNGDR